MRIWCFCNWSFDVLNHKFFGHLVICKHIIFFLFGGIDEIKYFEDKFSFLLVVIFILDLFLKISNYCLVLIHLLSAYFWTVYLIHQLNIFGWFIANGLIHISVGLYNVGVQFFGFFEMFLSFVVESFQEVLLVILFGGVAASSFAFAEFIFPSEDPFEEILGYFAGA